MSPPRSDAAFLEDILICVKKAQEFVQGMTYKEFTEDEKTYYAVIRAFEIIGEASKRISSGFRDKHPELPWKLMTGMRDKMIHDYFGVDLEVVWKTVNQNLPSVEPQLRLLLSEFQDSKG